MEYNKIQNKLEEYISFYERDNQTSITWDEYRQLEKLYKNNYLAEKLKERAKYLHEWMHNIGKEVYFSRKSFNYTLVDNFGELDTLNRNYFDNSFSTVFTQELFNNLCVNYCNYQVKRLTEELTERSITSNSTCKISNLVFEWQLECKQELIKIFKNLSEL